MSQSIRATSRQCTQWCYHAGLCCTLICSSEGAVPLGLIKVHGIPEAPVAAASLAKASPDTNVLQSVQAESLIGSQAENHTITEVSQADLADVEAQSMLTLDPRGHIHDIERYILSSAHMFCTPLRHLQADTCRRLKPSCMPCCKHLQ